MTSRLPKRAGRRFIPISPMPRIDGGLELVTADGELAARLQRSVRNLTSEFSVRVKGELGEDQIASILQGTLDSGETLRIEHCEPSGGEGANKWYVLGARGASGKEVRQLFERQGALVSRVLRTSLGPLSLERALARGRFRELTQDELTALTDAGSNDHSGWSEDQ
jgi:23S rRNA pseudouridine2605 synthase